MQRLLFTLACTLMPCIAAYATEELLDPGFRKILASSGVNLKAVAALNLPNDNVAVVYQIPSSPLLGPACDHGACVGLTIYDANGTTVLSDRIKDGNLRSVTAAAVDHLGRIVVIGATALPSNADFGVLRFLPTGEDDTSFNGTGGTRVPFDLGGNNDDIPRAVAIGQWNQIVVAGSVAVGAADSNNTDFGVIRLGNDGQLDGNLSGIGKTRISFDLRGLDPDQATAVAIDKNEKIIVGGTAFDSCLGRYLGDCLAGNRPVLVRLTAIGTMDSTFCPGPGNGGSECLAYSLGFGSIYGGRALYNLTDGAADASILGLDVADNGRIVLIGSAVALYPGVSSGMRVMLVAANGAGQTQINAENSPNYPQYRGVRFTDGQGSRVMVAGDIHPSNVQTGPGQFLLQVFDQNLFPVASYGNCMVNNSGWCFSGGADASSNNHRNMAASVHLDSHGWPLFAGTFSDDSNDPTKNRVLVQRFIPDRIFQNGFD